MTILNLSLLFASAWITLTAHIGMKKAHNRFTFLWLMMLAITIFYSPLLFFITQPIPSQLWIIMISSAVVEVIYYIAASNAYKTEELSIVFPMMRGTAPLFLLIGATCILHEHVTMLGMVGILIIVFGLMLINLKKLNQWHTILHRFKFPGMRWALCAGACVATYTLIDSVGVRTINPFIYVYLTMALTFIFLTPFILKHIHWHKITTELKADKGLSLLSGVTTLFSYSLVLYVIKHGMLAAYAGSIREMSIVFSGIIGVIFFKENFSTLKISGAILIACGITIIAIFGTLSI
jgi:drug/metabolite transporter (DMT)-like permease